MVLHLIGIVMADSDDPVVRVPIIEETATIDKVVVQTDAVRILTSVDEREVTVRDTVVGETFDIRRVTMDRVVDIAPPLRKEGSTTIISLVEERVVVEKRLFLIEEIHVTRKATQEHVAIPVTLRSTRATIERPSQTTGNASDD